MAKSIGGSGGTDPGDQTTAYTYQDASEHSRRQATLATQQPTTDVNQFYPVTGGTAGTEAHATDSGTSNSIPYMGGVIQNV